jgi:hypothetical protein
MRVSLSRITTVCDQSFDSAILIADALTLRSAEEKSSRTGPAQLGLLPEKRMVAGR